MSGIFLAQDTGEWMKNSVLAVMLAVGAALLIGCDARGVATGGCSDSDTLETLRSVIRERSVEAAGASVKDAELVRQGWAGGKVVLAIESIRTTAKDDAVKRSMCSAVLKVPLQPAVIESFASNIGGLVVLGAAGMKRSGDSLAVDITYTSQPTDDGKQVFVELQHGQEIARAAGVIVYAATVPAGTPAPALPTTPASAIAPSSPDHVAVANDDPLCQGLDSTVTADQLECLGRNFKAADRALNDGYKSAMAVLPEDRKTALRAEQRAWLDEKTKACRAAGAEFEGGSMEAVAQSDCEVQQTRARVGYVAGFK